MNKTRLKSFVFEIFLSEIVVRPFISLIAKFEVYNFLASKLVLSKMTYISAKTFSIPLP